MERLCYTFDLAPGVEREYERRHGRGLARDARGPQGSGIL